MRRLVVLGIVATTRAAIASPCSIELARSAFPDDVRVAVDKPIPLTASHLACRALRGTTLTLMTFQARPGVVLGAVVRNHDVIWTDGAADASTPSVTDTAFTAIDLDGDGRDELIVTAHKDGHMTTTADWLTVYTLDPIQPIGGIELGSTAGNQGSEQGVSLDYHCRSSWRVLPTRQIEQIGTCTGNPGDRAVLAGRHRYVLEAGQLVEH